MSRYYGHSGFTILRIVFGAQFSEKPLHLKEENNLLFIFFCGSFNFFFLTCIAILLHEIVFLDRKGITSDFIPANIYTPYYIYIVYTFICIKQKQNQLKLIYGNCI